MQDEFHAIALRKKLYQDLVSAISIDEWMMHYNEVRQHRGRYGYGKALMETFLQFLTKVRLKQLTQASPAA